MSNRAVVPVLAVLISSLASTALTVSAFAVPATDDKAEAPASECLTTPKAETPKGAHWYYRLEKGTKRKCWYLADQVAKAGKTASASAPSASPAPPRAPDTAIQPSIANARAELATRSPKAETASDDVTLSETIWPEPERQADSPAPRNDQRAGVKPENPAAGSAAAPATNGGAITSRWPESTLPGAPDSQSTPRVETRPQQSAATQAGSLKEKSASLVAAERFTGLSFNSTAMLVIMLAGVLTVVAIVGRMIIKYAGNRQRKDRDPRRHIWDNVRQDNASDAYEALLQPRNSQFASVPTEASDPGNEIEQLLQRVSKRAAA